MDKNIKSILLECLNDNIRLEEKFYFDTISEATLGATGGAPSPSTPTGSGSTGSGGFVMTPMPGMPGGVAPFLPATPGMPGSTFAPMPGLLPGLSLPTVVGSTGGSSTPPPPTKAKTGKTGKTTPPPTVRKLTGPTGPSTGGGRGAGLAGATATGPTGGVDILSALGLVGAASVTNFTANLLKKVPTGIYGQNWVTRNIANILPKQEELRKEGLGYTKGWASLADTK